MPASESSCRKPWLTSCRASSSTFWVRTTSTTFEALTRPFRVLSVMRRSTLSSVLGAVPDEVLVALLAVSLSV